MIVGELRKETIGLPPECEGRVWRHKFRGQTCNMHRHDELEINFVTRGCASYLLGDRKYELHRHDLVWLFPEQDHILLDQTSDYEMWILVFHPRLVERVSTQPKSFTLREPNPQGDFCRGLSESWATRLIRLYEEIQPTEGSADLHNAGLTYALSLSWEAHNATAQILPFSDVHPCVEKAARLLQTADDLPDLPRLAHAVGMSTSRLSRLFKQQTGVALSEFRNRRRIERFLEIYGSGHRHSLRTAAFEAGFGSYPQFHRVFKTTTGHTPAQHRRSRSS